MKLFKLIGFVFLILFSLISVNATLNTTSLKVDYTLDNTLVDATGNHSDLTNNGSSYTPTGKIQGAYDFESGDGDFLGGGTRIITTDSDFSWSIWIKPETMGATQYILSEGITGGFHYGWRVFESSSTEIRFDVRGGGSTGTGLITGLSNGNWFHLVGTYDASTNSIKTYINNVASGTGVNSFTIGTTDEFDVGRLNLGGSTYDGIIDEISIWNKVLTISDINELYNNGNGFTLFPSISQIQLNI